MPAVPGEQRLERQLLRQADACAQLGSTLYAELMHQAAADVAAGGFVRDLLRGHEEDPADSVLALRLFGTVHRLVLEGKAPELSAFYPSAGGQFTAGVDAERAWSAWLSAARRHADALRAGLAWAPQTNEVGRAAVLLGGLAHLTARAPLPVRLVELGASGGLNLRADAFRLTWEGGAWGPADSPVQLPDSWRGRLPPLSRVEVVDRVGYDVRPLDPTTDDGALALLSYVWPDQLARLARLRAAIEIARAAPVALYRASAAEAVRAVDLQDGVWTVVWHSLVWQYLPTDERAEVELRLTELGGQATYAGPLAHLAFEPRRRGAERGGGDGAGDGAGGDGGGDDDGGDDPEGAVEFVVSLRTWPGGEEQVLGAAAPHGLPVTWD